jgi:hypothetical protein
VKTKWLARDTVRAPHMTLCLSERAFLSAAKHCGVKNPDPWLEAGRLVACVHTWERAGKLTSVVCLHPDSRTADPIEVAATLVHEAVHVFQRLCDSIGETSPSREFEAYSIERIAERLMREFKRQVQVNDGATAP